MLPPQFSYRRGLETCDHLLTLSHNQQVALDRGMEGSLVQLGLSAAFDKVSHYGLLYNLSSIGVGGLFLSIVSEYLSDGRKCVRLDGKISASVDVVSRVTLLFILYTSELFHIVENRIVGYADDTMIYAVIPRPLSRSQVRLNPKKTKSMVVSRSRTSAPGYGELTLGSAELEEAKSLHILGVTYDSKLTFEMHLREVVSKAARNLGVVAEQESYLIVYVCSRAVSMHMVCPVWSIAPPCGYRRWSLILICLIVLFTVRKGCVRASFVILGSEERLVV